MSSKCGRNMEMLQESIHRRKTEGCSEDMAVEFRERLDELLDRKIVLSCRG